MINQQLKQIIKPLKKALIYIILFSAVVNLLMLVPPLYMLQIFDRVMVSRSEETLIMLTLVVLWLFLAMGLLEFTRGRLMNRLSNQLDMKINDTLYQNMVTQAIAKPGQGTSQPISDLNTIRQFLTGNASRVSISVAIP
jgi:ATP-binding cassette subfamily C protein EexD